MSKPLVSKGCGQDSDRGPPTCVTPLNESGLMCPSCSSLDLGLSCCPINFILYLCSAVRPSMRDRNSPAVSRMLSSSVPCVSMMVLMAFQSALRCAHFRSGRRIPSASSSTVTVTLRFHAKGPTKCDGESFFARHTWAKHECILMGSVELWITLDKNMWTTRSCSCETGTVSNRDSHVSCSAMVVVPVMRNHPHVEPQLVPVRL